MLADIEVLKNEWLEIKKQYWELIQSRVRLLNEGGIEALKKDNQRFVRLEFKLYNLSEKARRKYLHHAKEEICGRFTLKGHISAYGDNGYFFCRKCGMLFEHMGREKEKPGVSHTHTFSTCNEHETRTPFGRMTKTFDFEETLEEIKQ